MEQFVCYHLELYYRNHYNIYLVHCTALNVVIEQFPIFNIGKITFSGSIADLISAISTHCTARLLTSQASLQLIFVFSVNVFPDIKDAIAKLISTSALMTLAKTEADASTLWLDTNANAPVDITDPDANQMSTNAPPTRVSMAVPVRTASAILFASAKRGTKAKDASKKSICANPTHANMAESAKRISIPTLANANQASRVKTARSTSMIVS